PYPDARHKWRIGDPKECPRALFPDRGVEQLPQVRRRRIMNIPTHVGLPQALLDHHHPWLIREVLGPIEPFWEAAVAAGRSSMRPVGPRTGATTHGACLTVPWL